MVVIKPDLRTAWEKGRNARRILRELIRKNRKQSTLHDLRENKTIRS